MTLFAFHSCQRNPLYNMSKLIGFKQSYLNATTGELVQFSFSAAALAFVVLVSVGRLWPQGVTVFADDLAY